MIKSKSLIVILSMLWLTLPGFSHGIKTEVKKQPPCVSVTSMYHGGIALADAEVRVLGENRAREFQRGWTDQKGSFSFVPDTAGSWFFQVDDGMGHKKEINIEIGSDFFVKKEPVEQKPLQVSVPGENSRDQSEGGGANVPGRPNSKPLRGDAAEARDDCIYCKILFGLVLIFTCAFILYRRKRKG